MKTIIKFTLAAACALSLFSCESPELELVALEESYTFTKEGTPSHVFSVVSNTDWTITKTGLDWLEISPMSGNGDGTITLTCQPNPDFSSREGTFTFSSEVVTRTIKVTQEANSIDLSVTGTLDEFSIDGGSQTFEVSSNASWTINVEGDWFNVSPTEGDAGSATVTVTAPEHVGSSLSGSITVVSGDKQEVLDVKQRAADDYFVEFLPGQMFTWAICNGASPSTTFMKDASWKEIGGWRNDGKQYADNPSQPFFKGGDAAAAREAAKAACNKHPLVYLEWVKAKSDAAGYTSTSFVGHNTEGVIKSTGFGFTGEKYCAFFINKVSFQLNDAFVYHIPVRHIDAGKTIVLHFGMSSSSPKKQKYWAIEYSFDNGKTWSQAQTSKNYPEYGANYLVAAQASVDPFWYKEEAKCPVDKAIDYDTVLIRARIANQETMSGVEAGEAIGSWAFTSEEFDGPWIELK